MDLDHDEAAMQRRPLTGQLQAAAGAQSRIRSRELLPHERQYPTGVESKARLRYPRASQVACYHGVSPNASPSSRGLGRGPFKAKTRVRIPLGTPPLVKSLESFPSATA